MAETVAEALLQSIRGAPWHRCRIVSRFRDEDTEVPEALADPEARAMRESTRATAAAVLVASGNTEGAKRLLRMTPERRK
jgi:hypothetical protein